MPTIRVTAATASTALLLALAGCGGSTPKASELASGAKSSSLHAKSVDVSIVGQLNGVRTQFDASGKLDGTNQRQIQSQGKAKSDGIIVGNKAYLKANQEFWQGIGTPAQTAGKLKDKWWVGDSTSGSSPALDVKKLLNDFFSSAEGKKLSSDKARVKESTTGGKPTYTVSDPDDLSAAKIIVTRDGDHRLVRIENYASQLTQTKASYSFSDWNSVKTYKAPSGAKPISSVTGAA